MALTAQEEAELKQLEQEQSGYEDANKGNQAVDQVDQARLRPVKPTDTRPFSPFRATVGALRDAAQNVFDFTEDVGDELQRRVPLPVVRFGHDAGNGLVDVVAGQQATDFTNRTRQTPQLPGLKGEDHAGTAENVVRTIGSFVVPFAGVAKTLGVAKAASWLGRAGRAMAAGGIVDSTMNPETTNLANTMRDVFGIDSPTLNALASEPDDNRLVARFKAAAVNAPVGLAADAVFEAGLRGVRAYRAWRGSLTEADAAVKAARADLPVTVPIVADHIVGDLPAKGLAPALKIDGKIYAGKPNTSHLDVAELHGVESSLTGGVDSGFITADGQFLDRKEALAWLKKGGTRIKPSDPGARNELDAVDYRKQTGGAHAAQQEPIEDAFDFLKRKATTGATEEDANAFAETFLHHPEEALSRAGINPLKIDFSAMDNPEMLGKLHSSLQDIYEGIANRLGRTGSVITEEMTARAARTMATTSDVLKDLYGHTANLDAVMYASQAVVGAHAQKLVGLAESALAAAKAGTKTGTGEQEWLDFLEAFHRHAYFLGALRGAGSEVGRALRTLQMVQKVGRKTAARNVGEALAKSPERPDAAARALATTATDQVTRMQEPAERTLFLGKLIDSGGDLGDLSRFTRAMAGSTLRRLDSSLGELRGNLFSAVTGVTNALSGFTILGLRGASMALASLKSMALSPLGRTYSQAARVQTMVTWAYVDGILGGWRAAWHNTLSLLEREGMEEVVLNAEGWGAKGLATKAASLADEGRRGVVGNFERVDISSRERSLVMSSADMRALNETIESWSTPALMEHSMKWLLKAARPAVNAFGSASRLGTILFVNGADQFTGTVAARAGAQAEAMRIAAHEAAELQLEGKPLGQYMKARMVQLTETVNGFADDAYSAGQHQVALAAGEVEAKGALFQDPLEFGALRGLANGMSHTPFFHLLVPFVKTPLRILERTTIDYTPLGLLKDRVRADVMAGGTRRDEALARIGLGSMMVYTAYQLAEDRGIVGIDGDYHSSARLSRPSYSLKVGDDVIEFKRFDPVGTLLGLGADFRAYMDDQQDVPPDERGSKAEQMIEASVWAAQANVLSKTWLTSLRDLVDLASNVKEGQSADGWARYLESFATRFVPGSGIQRSLARGAQGVDREAAGFQEGILKQSFGSAKLPIKRDGLLGRPVPVESGDRLLGLKAGPGPSDLSDPLLAELDRLSFDIGKPSRTFHGVRLNSSQYSRFLELRGQIVTKDSTGLTLEGALGQLIKLPEYKALPRAGKVQAIRDEINGYGEKASARLVQEDHELARHVAANQVWDKALLDGTDSGEVDRQTQELFQQLGLTDGQQ